MRLFKREELTEPETYGVINFKESIAKKGICIGGSMAKEILLINNGVIVDILPFSESYIDYLEEKHSIPVVDATQGRLMPEECEEASDIKVDLGKIFIIPRKV